MKLVALESDRVVLERVPEAPPGVAPGLVLRALPDGAEALSFLRRGQIHVLAEVSPAHIPRELAKPAMAPRFEGWLLTPPRYDLLLYNLRRSGTAELTMRRVFDTAIPREAIAELHVMPPAPVRAPVDLLEPQPIDLAALEAAGPGARWGMAGLPFDRRPIADEVGQASASMMLDALRWPLDRGWRRRSTGALRPVLLWNGASGLGSEVAGAIRRAYKAVGIQLPSATAGWAYIHGLMRKGEFDVALLRLVEHSDHDLYPDFHSKGASNLSGISDAALDEALEAYRRARDRAARDAAKRAIAARLAELLPVSLLYAPTQVMLIDRRVEGVQFVDDLPRLDTLRLRADGSWLTDH